MEVLNNIELTMDTVVEFNFKNGSERAKLGDLYNPQDYANVEELYTFVGAWLRTGRAKIINTKSREEQIADKIAEELLRVEEGNVIAQDRVDRLHYNDDSHGIYKKVGFPAKTLLYAQEMVQQLIRNFNLSQDQLGIEMKGTKVMVTITDCPIKTYANIERVFGIKRATEAVSGAVEKTANAAVNVTDMTINSLAVPVAKTAIGTTAKIGKSLVGLGAKLGGILVGEVTKNAKQCCNEIKSDGYIAEAVGEVQDGIHTMRRAIGNTNFGGYGGEILE